MYAKIFEDLISHPLAVDIETHVDCLPDEERDIVTAAIHDINHGARCAFELSRQKPDKADAILFAHEEGARAILDDVARRCHGTWICRCCRCGKYFLRALNQRLGSQTCIPCGELMEMENAPHQARAVASRPECGCSAFSSEVTP